MRTTFTAVLGFFLGAIAAVPVAAQTPGEQVRRLTVDEAVRLAIDNNLGIQIARYNPQVQDLAVAQAKAAWVPSFNNTFQKNSQASPNNNFLAGSLTGKTTNAAFSNSTGVSQQLPWGGGSYAFGWNSLRTNASASLSNFNPSVTAQLQAAVNRKSGRRSA